VLYEIVSAALQMTDRGKLHNTMRRDECDVDEDVGEEFAAAWMIASKMRRVRWAYDERRRKNGWNCGPCRRILQAELW